MNTPVKYKTLIQNSNMFNELPDAVLGNSVIISPNRKLIIDEKNLIDKKRTVEAGKTSQRRVYKAHKEVYQRVLIEHKQDLRKPIEEEINKLEDLKNRVNSGKPTTTALKKVSLKKVPEKKLMEEVFAKPSKENKLGVLKNAKEGLLKNTDKIQNTTKIHDTPIEDSTNFAVAELVFLITTKNSKNNKLKELHLSFPLNIKKEGERLPNATYNYKDIDGAYFKRFFMDYHKGGKSQLTEWNVEIMGRNSTIDEESVSEEEYPQLAFHSEKFMYYYLLNDGISHLVSQLSDRGIVPEIVKSIDGVILRMHSTKDMCDTCEVVSIGVRNALLRKINTELVKLGFEQVKNGSQFAIEMSSDIKGGRKIKEEAFQKSNWVGVRSQNVSNLTNPEKARYDGTGSRVHSYTFFTSGGQSNASCAVNLRKLHERGVRQMQEESLKIWQQKENEAAVKIQTWYRSNRQLFSRGPK